jgi:hypothetical protein
VIARIRSHPSSRHPAFAWTTDPPDEPVAGADPESCLLFAVLERAVLDLGGKGQEHGHRSVDGSRRPTTQSVELEAFEWVASDVDELWSFGWVCDHLALSASALRQQMFILAVRLRAGRLVKSRGEWHAT